MVIHFVYGMSESTVLIHKIDHPAVAQEKRSGRKVGDDDVNLDVLTCRAAILATRRDRRTFKYCMV